LKKFSERWPEFIEVMMTKQKPEFFSNQGDFDDRDHSQALHNGPDPYYPANSKRSRAAALTSQSWNGIA